MHFLVEYGLTRPTIQRRLAELRNARNIVAHWPSRRKEYVLSPEDANEQAYYAALLLTLNKWCEETYPGCKCPPSEGSEQSDG